MSEPTTNCASGRCGQATKPCKHVWSNGVCVACGIEWRVWASRRIQELECLIAEKEKALEQLARATLDYFNNSGEWGRYDAIAVSDAWTRLEPFLAALRKEGEKG